MGGNGADYITINGIRVKTDDIRKMAGMKFQDCKNDFFKMSLFNSINNSNGRLADQLEAEEIDAYLEQKAAEMDANAKNLEKTPAKTNVTPQKIAQLLYDDMKGAGTDKNFNSHMNGIRKDNVADIVLQYNNISEKSLAASILGETDILGVTGLSKEKRLGYIDKIYNNLLTNAKELGIDTSQFENKYKFTKITVEKNYEFDFKNDIFDETINGLASAINGKSELSKADKKNIQNLTFKDTSGSLDKTVTEASNKKLDVSKANGYLQAADWMSQAFSCDGLKKSEKNEKEIEDFKKQLARLQACTTEEAFVAKFQDIFGVKYDKELVYAYQQRREKIPAIEKKQTIEQSFNSDMKLLLSGKALKAEYKTEFVTDTLTENVQTASKEQVFEREFIKLAEYLDIKNEGKGAEILKNKLVQYSNLDEMYAEMQNIAKDLSQDFHNDLMEATDGKGYNAFMQECDSMYDAAFGMKNNIARQVEKNNIQMEKNAEHLMMGSKLGLGLAATALGPVGGALVVGAGSITMDAIDVGVSENGKAKLKEQAGNIIVNGAVDGALFFVGGKAAGLGFTKNMAINTVAGVTGDAIKNDGNITPEGTVMNTLMATLGSVSELNVSKSKGAIHTNKPTGKTQKGKTKAANTPETKPAAKTETRIINGEKYEFNIDENGAVDFTHAKVNGQEAEIGLQDDIMLGTWDGSSEQQGILGNLFRRKKNTSAPTNPAHTQNLDNGSIRIVNKPNAHVKPGTTSADGGMTVKKVTYKEGSPQAPTKANQSQQRQTNEQRKVETGNNKPKVGKNTETLTPEQQKIKNDIMDREQDINNIKERLIDHRQDLEKAKNAKMRHEKFREADKAQGYSTKDTEYNALFQKYDDEIANIQKNIDECETAIKTKQAEIQDLKNKLTQTGQATGTTNVSGSTEPVLGKAELGNTLLDGNISAESMELKSLSQQIKSCDDGIKNCRDGINQLKKLYNNAPNKNELDEAINIYEKEINRLQALKTDCTIKKSNIQGKPIELIRYRRQI